MNKLVKLQWRHKKKVDKYILLENLGERPIEIY